MRFQNLLYTLFLLAGLVINPATSQASLVGLSPKLPTIEFSGSGIINYSASTGIFNLSATPSTLFSLAPFIFTDIPGTTNDNIKNLSIQFQTDNTGNLLTSNNSQPDLVIIGSIDTDGDGIVDLSGTLLTGKAVHFGFLNNISNGDDVFDIQLNTITGALAYLYDEQDLAVRIISEVSAGYPNAFNNSFSHSWQGQAKGVIGSTDPLDTPIAMPIPATLWLSISALGILLPYTRRSRLQQQK